MYRRPPRSTRTDTPFPYTTLFRSDLRWGVTATWRVPTADANKPAPVPDTALSRGIFRKPDHRRIIAMSSSLIAGGHLLDATAAPIKPNTPLFAVGNQIEFIGPAEEAVPFAEAQGPPQASDAISNTDSKTDETVKRASARLETT